MIMAPGVRKFALAAHLTLSVGWIGAVAAYIALDVTGATSQDPQILRSVYLAMEVVARNVIVPLAFASLGTGLVMSLGTKWGLFRHYWVLFSLVMTTVATVVLMLEMQTIRGLADIAESPTVSGDDLRALPSTLGHSVGGTVVLLLVLFLNIYKPRGLTRYGQRKQREQRVAREHFSTAAAASDAGTESRRVPIDKRAVTPRRPATAKRPKDRPKPRAGATGNKPTGRTGGAASSKRSGRRGSSA